MNLPIRCFLLSLFLIPAAVALPPRDAPARPSEPLPSDGTRVDAFNGWYHDAGDLLLHVSNRARYGRGASDPGTPSAEWPAGSGHEYLYAAGLWFGGIVAPDTMVTAALYQFNEFYNHEPDEGCGDPVEGICVGGIAAPGGARLVDDDGDGSVDEERLDGADNDFDGLVDEDYAGISDQMYAAAFYDSSTIFNQFFPDPADHHRPLGLSVTQETYVWSDDASHDFVGMELNIRNVSPDLDAVGWDIEQVYAGMMVDADVGIGGSAWSDDQCGYVAVDTSYTDGGVPIDASIRMAYAFDEPGQGGDDVPGYLGVMLLGDDVHAFRVWSSGAADPTDDVDRYEFLRGASDVTPTIDPPTTLPNDYRFLVSVGPLGTLAVDETTTLRWAFVCGDMVAGPGGLTPDLTNPLRAQRIHDGYADRGGDVHWTTGAPPVPPAMAVGPGNGQAIVEWDDSPEAIADPTNGTFDFAGYFVERNGPFVGTAPGDGWSVVAEWDAGSLGEIETGETGVGHYRWENRGLRNFQRYAYRVGTVDADGWRIPGAAVIVEPQAVSAAWTEPVLARPNPWRAGVDDGTPVRFLHLPETATVRLYAVDGRRVGVLAPGRSEWMPPAGGVYLWRAEDADGRIESGKVVVLR